MRDSLRALLGVPCFIRRSRSPDALFISDLPRRTVDAEDIVRRLEAGGQWRTWMRNGLLELDPAPLLWHSLIRSAPRVAPRPQDWYADYPFLAACARRLIADSPPPERQPVDPLRLTLKRLDAGELDLLERELPPILALLLRRREPLPAAAGLYVLGELHIAPPTNS